MIAVCGGSGVVTAPTPFKGHWPSEIVIAEHIFLRQPAAAAVALGMCALCNNNSGGHFMFCWCHGSQCPLNGVAATTREPQPTAIIRQRMLELHRIQYESQASEARDDW